jgi:hypothetical protein
MVTVSLFIAAMGLYGAPVRQGEIDTIGTEAIRNYVFAGGGATWFDISKLNNKLGLLNVPAFSDHALSLSLGGRMDQGNSIFESVVTGNFWKGQVRSNVLTTMWSGDVFINSGINLFRAEEPISFFPYIGAGLGFTTMSMGSDQKKVSELATNPQQPVFLWQGSVLANAGLGADLFFIDPDKKGSLVLGIRAGYCYDIYTMERWYSRNTKVFDLPSLRHSGAYVRIVLGSAGSAALQ